MAIVHVAADAARSDASQRPCGESRPQPPDEVAVRVENDDVPRAEVV